MRDWNRSKNREAAEDRSNYRSDIVRHGKFRGSFRSGESPGTGERGNETREILCDKLKFLGIEIDKEANKVKAEERKISTDNSKVQIYVVPTNEELMIARETKQILKDR